MSAKPTAVVIDDESLARERLCDLLAQDGRVTLAGQAADGASGLRLIEETQPDLAFIDIQMPEMTGMQLTTALHDSGATLPQLVFVTAYDSFALEAFNLNATDYLLKPFDRARFKQALDKALAAQPRNAPDGLEKQLASLIASFQPKPQSYLSRLSIKADGRILIVPTSEIDWIGAAGNYVEIHAKGACHLMRETLSQLESQLDPSRFLRISRSVIVATDRIREIHPLFHGEHALLLTNGEKLTASRSYRDALAPLLGNK